MTTIRNSRHRGILFLTSALFAFLTLAPAAQAQPRARQDRVSNAGYQRMRQFARQLDELARDANRQAQADQAGYRGIRRDTKFLQSISHFATRTREFRARMETYRTRAWNVDEEVEHLLRDARNVQTRINRARFADARTRQDWAEVVNVLDNLRDEYLYGGRSVNNRNNRNNPNRYPGTYDDRDGRVYDDRDGRVYDDRDGRVYDDRDGRVYRDGDGRVYNDNRYGSTDLRQLAYELDQRAARASQLAGGGSGYGRYNDYSDIREFSEQAREFRTLVDQNRMTQSQLRSEVNELLEDAQDAYEDLRRANISRELSTEWDAVVQILNRMRQMVIA
ncbi:MAG: hypothetical protein ABI610_01220 [Acidobacteriota bacterium]